MTWFGAFMLKGIIVCVVLTIIGFGMGLFIKDYEWEEK